MNYILGVDIGGTHTDAILLNAQEKIVASFKAPTTDPLDKGFEEALKHVLKEATVATDEISGIFIGTTHATNALLQQKHLHRVGVLRLAGHQPHLLPPAFLFEKSLREKVVAKTVTINGGYRPDGKPITALQPQEIFAAIDAFFDCGVESIAICGTFSPFYSDQEKEVAAWIQSLTKTLPLTLSHEIGGIGFIERENAAILNASLKKVMANGFLELAKSALKLGIKAPLFITQNNGSLMTLSQAIDYPVLTLSAGPTNSFLGGAKLAGFQDAIVIDIGGTTTDVGLVQNGFAKRRLHHSSVGGIPLNFPAPDVLSLALGGGSRLFFGKNGVEIGPESAARRLKELSQAFGGPFLTLTDAALFLNIFKMEGADLKKIAVTESQANAALQKTAQQLEKAVAKMEGIQKDLPVVLVGGGAKLIPDSLLAGRYQTPLHSGVANAYGAALAEISSTVDTVISLNEREMALDGLKEKVFQKATSKGASSLRLVDQKIIPYYYMPGNMARVILTAAGKKARI